MVLQHFFKCVIFFDNIAPLWSVRQAKLVVVPDNMAAGLLRAVSRLLDVSVLPSEPTLRFLSHCCLSLLALLITLQTDSPTETDHKRCAGFQLSRKTSCKVICNFPGSEKSTNFFKFGS